MRGEGWTAYTVAVISELEQELIFLWRLHNITCKYVEIGKYLGHDVIVK